MRFNRATFFKGYRSKYGPLAQLQVDGLNFLLDKIEADQEWDSIPEIAYFLATVKHETGITRHGELQTYQPIKELRAQSGTELYKSQSRYWKTGHYGRGFIQLTWLDNYAKFGIEDSPDAALDPDMAYQIAADGMRKGMFTKFKLSDFVNGKKDYVGARLVVNGHDKALLIAGYADSFEGILKEAEESDVPVVEPVKEDKPSPSVETVQSNPPVVEVKANGVSWLTKIQSAIAPIGTFATGVGLKIGGFTITRDVLLVFMVCLTVSFAIGAWVYNRGKNPAQL